MVGTHSTTRRDMDKVLEVVRLLLDRGADVDVQYATDQSTRLHYALRYTHTLVSHDYF
jgi:hypothetical protein